MVVFIYRPHHYAGMYILVGWTYALKPHSPAINLDVNCQIKDRPVPMNLFAFRTHTHKHGTLVRGYLRRGNQIEEIASHDPQEPQMFYPMDTEVTVDNGDFLGARCTFNTTLENSPVYMGMFHNIYHNMLKIC